MAGQSNREREIFNSALDRATLAERIAYVDGACGEDLELRARVAALLSAHDSAGAFLPMDGPMQQPAALPKSFNNIGDMFPVAEQPGDWIGPYKLREKIGEGG